MDNKLDQQYQTLLQTILDFGVEKKDRTGTGTKSIFGWQIRHNMSDGFPLLTTKKMAWKQIVTELLWFLRGDTNIKYLVDNGCHIWDGDAYKNYTQTKVIKTENSETHISLPGHYNGITQEEFINKCKTNPEFSEKWGLKITERELSEEERWRIRFDYYPKDKQFPWDRMALPSHRFLDDFNIPTKLITITYNDKTIESYE